MEKVYNSRFSHLNPLSGGGIGAIVAVAAVLAAGVGYYIYTRPPVLPSSHGTVLTPGNIAITGVAPFASIVLTLPAGAKWRSISVDGGAQKTLPADGVSPVTEPSGSHAGTILATWIDSSGAAQQTTVTYGP